MSHKHTSTHCTIVPPHMLEHLARAAETHPELAAFARSTLEHDASVRTKRRLTAVIGAPEALARGVGADRPQRTIDAAHHKQILPGTQVRAEGGQESDDAAVNQAYDGLGDTFNLYLKAYGRNSIDGRGLPLVATVHYGEMYENAFWNGEQMVFGDGDGTIFLDFTSCIDVIGHELTHGVTQYTANLNYYGQSGALNESLSDVFGTIIKQWVLGQTVEQADWMIGAELLGPTVGGYNDSPRGLRSMKDPGTAYDDPRLGGKDPQPASMNGYVRTSADNGGVHINSGIPNRAFYLTAKAIGGNAWEKAGQIWYDTLTGGELAPDAQFADFARLTVAAAKSRYGDQEEAKAVLDAWSQVGVPTNGSA
ncbi:M4 family metallopeptidase [Streptomyces sp. NPDC049099]|uniref:M4 family metallopeptidase n=1 Tax=Streptomyces sp. NPDC049099 TaxID=3155768 RepID=UPI00343DBA26